MGKFGLIIQEIIDFKYNMNNEKYEYFLSKGNKLINSCSNNEDEKQEMCNQLNKYLKEKY